MTQLSEIPKFGVNSQIQLPQVPQTPKFDFGFNLQKFTNPAINVNPTYMNAYNAGSDSVPDAGGIQYQPGMITGQFEGNTGLAGSPTGMPTSPGLNPELTSPIVPQAGGVAGGSGYSLFGTKDDFGNETKSSLGAGLGVAKGLFDAYLGYKNLAVAEDTLDFNKEAFSKQFENQKKTINTRYKDRQIARRSAGSSYQDVDSYMAENKL